jgi:hypothetical protein
MNNDIFKNAYLAQLGLIKEDVDNLPETDQPADTPAETELKQITFLTSDPVLIDALNSGFEEVVFFVNAKNEETGEDEITEVKFGKDSFGDVQISEVEEEIEECKEITEEIDEEYADDEDLEADEEYADDEEYTDEDLEADEEYAE